MLFAEKKGTNFALKATATGVPEKTCEYFVDQD